MPCDSQLPSNYTTILPGLAMEAFKVPKFEWGKVPEWIPPVERSTGRDILIGILAGCIVVGSDFDKITV